VKMPRWGHHRLTPLRRSWLPLPEVGHLHGLGGGGLLPPHFPLLIDGTSCASIKGVCCHSPLHEDSDPFVGGGPQIGPLQRACHTAAARRRNSSRNSSSRTVRNTWGEVWQLLGNPQPMSLQPWDNCTHTCSAAASHHPQVSGMTSTKEVCSAYKHFT
jgi:hypothetical protein